VSSTTRVALPATASRATVAPIGAVAQVVRFAAIGLLSTLAYLLLYLLLRAGLPAQGANVLALLITAIGNTAANRRYTYAIRGRESVVRHQLQGLLLFAAALGLTSGALATLHAVSAHPARAAEVAVLVVANLTATVLRFLLLRGWVFRQRPGAARASIDPDLRSVL